MNIGEFGSFITNPTGGLIHHKNVMMDELLGQVWIDLKPNRDMTYTLGDSWNMHVRSLHEQSRLDSIKGGYPLLETGKPADRIPFSIADIPLAYKYGEEMFPVHGRYTELQFPRVSFDGTRIKKVTILRKDFSDDRLAQVRRSRAYGWGTNFDDYIGYQEMLVHQRELAQATVKKGIPVSTGVNVNGVPQFDPVSLADMTNEQFDEMLKAATKKIKQLESQLAGQTESYRRGLGYNTRFNGGLIPSFANGGIVPNFDSMSVPAILHGGEYVVNSKAVKNIGFAALEAMNNMRFNTPKSPSYAGPVQPQTSSTSNINIYVDNFIGEKQWFESMMKDYNINVSPQNQKTAGLQNRTISTYNGINRGM
jgi:hypothetical protein